MRDRACGGVDGDGEDVASSTTGGASGAGEGQPVSGEIGVNVAATGEVQAGVDAGGGAFGQSSCGRSELEVGSGLCGSAISARVDGGNEEGGDIDAIVVILSGESCVIAPRQAAITGEK